MDCWHPFFYCFIDLFFLSHISLIPESRTPSKKKKNTNKTNKAILRKLQCRRLAYGFVTYLMEYAFTFTFASRKFPPMCDMTALIRLVTLIFDILISK